MLQNHFPLSAEICRDIEREGTLRTYKKGHTLYLQGEKLDTVNFLLSGLVCFWVNTPDHDQMLLSISEPGTIMGDVLLVDDGVRAYTCTALEDCSIFSVPSNFMRNLAATNLEFSQFLNHALTLKLRRAMHSVYRSRFSSKTQQLADILQELCSVNRSDTIAITQAQLAHMIDCSRPTIIAKLKEFENQKLIRMRYGRIKIIDMTRLTALGA